MCAYCLLCVFAVCLGQNPGRLQTQEQQDQRRSVPLSHRHAEHVSQTSPILMTLVRLVETEESPCFRFRWEVCPHSSLSLFDGQHERFKTKSVAQNKLCCVLEFGAVWPGKSVKTSKFDASPWLIPVLWKVHRCVSPCIRWAPLCPHSF